jgi:GT2 family glycosyltransferase/glycosyltransferase involved in cell wall biosynthesis
MSDSVSVVGAYGGDLVVASDIANFSRDYVLDCAGWKTEFAPSELNPATDLIGVNVLVNGDLSAPPSEWQVVQPRAGVGVSRNVTPAFTLADGNTGYLGCAREVPTASVRYVDPILGPDLPVVAGREYIADGWFAAHRCEGRLKVVIHDSKGEVVDVSDAAITPAFRGGKDLDDYHHVRVQVTIPPAGASLSYVIELASHVAEPEDDGANAYVFFTQCGLAQGTAIPERQGPRPEIAVPLMKQAAGVVAGGAMYVAPVEPARLDGVEAIFVRRRDALDKHVARYVLPDVSAAQAMIAPLAGNSIALTLAGYDGPLTVFVDGQAVQTLPAAGRAGERRQTNVVVPSRFFDGSLHMLEVREGTGLRVLARTADVFPAVSTPWNALQQYAGHPMPSQLSPAASYRYRSLVRAIDGLSEADATGAERVAMLGRLQRVLDGGFETLKDFAPLAFPAVNEPTVSIVVPVHNKFNVTYYCLCAVLFASNDASFEVIVVDDGSSDETLQIEDIVSNITVVRHETARGFVGACNAGASRARGRFIVLLNNDTEPTEGWLDELLGAFERFDDVGLAGSRLLYPDGRLQEAGGIVWRTGNPWNYGRGDNPRDPRYTYARQADYLSGAALMLPRDVWEEVGALSEEYAPAYFEDTDLAFKVRDAGYTTWYVPSSVVYHFEGVSNGTDVAATSGLKRFQEINRPKFRRRWAAAVRSNGDEGVEPDLAKDRGILGRVLFIDTQVPRPDHDAGSYATLNEMLLVQSLGYKVTCLPTNVAYMGRYTEELNRYGVETIYAPFCFSVDQFLRERGREFDAVYITRFGVASIVLDSVRAHAPQAKVLFCNCDLHFLREIRAALQTTNQEAWDKAVATRDAELEVMRRVDVVLSYNEVEHSVILSHTSEPLTVVTCPWVVEVSERSAAVDFTDRQGIAFLGNYRHPPNVEAVHFFVEEVMPLLTQRIPDVVFHIYGSSMPDTIKSLAGPNINPVGHVATVDEAYDAHRVFVAPLLSGAGIKGKVLGAIAHGIPSVVSPVAAEGTGLRHGYDCMISREPEQWVEAIADLYEKDKMWTTLRTRGMDLVRTDYSFDRGRRMMREAFEAVGIFNTKP